MSAFGGKADMIQSCSDVRFSNRPFGVKHFQTIRRCSVDVAHGFVLLFGIGTRALPSWDSNTRWNDLLGGLAVSCRQVQADMRTHLIHRPARDIIPPLGGCRPRPAPARLPPAPSTLTFPTRLFGFQFSEMPMSLRERTRPGLGTPPRRRSFL